MVHKGLEATQDNASPEPGAAPGGAGRPRWRRSRRRKGGQAARPIPKPAIVAVVEDLFFAAKIGETARRAGVAVAIVTTEEALLKHVAEKPRLVIIDLNLNALQPLPLITRLKSHPDLQRTSVLGFVSHVQGDLKLEAQKAGCDVVLARSSFSQNLPLILKRHAG